MADEQNPGVPMSFHDLADTMCPDNTATERKLAQRLLAGQEITPDSVKATIMEIRAARTQPAPSPGRAALAAIPTPPVHTPPISKSDQGAPRPSHEEQGLPINPFRLPHEVLAKMSPSQWGEAVRNWRHQMGAETDPFRDRRSEIEQRRRGMSAGEFSAALNQALKGINNR